MSAKEWLILLVLSILWGGSFFFIAVAVTGLPPLTIVAVRVALAAATLYLVLMLLKRPLAGGGDRWKVYVTMGILNNVVPFCLIVWGQTQIASGLAAILNATTPMFTVLLAHVLTQDEKLTLPRAIGVGLGFIGVVYLVGGGVLSGAGDHFWAEMAVVAAALFYALAGLYGRRFKAMGVEPLHAATGQLTASAVLLIPVALWVDIPWLLPMPGLDVWWSLLGLAVVSTSLAYILYFRLLATAGATNLLLVTLLIPVSANILGVSFLGERLGGEQLFGMTLIGLGLLVIDGRVLRRLGAR